MVSRVLLGVALAFLRTAARECGQKEIDAQDISGCVSVTHMKHIGHKKAVWLGEALKNNTVLETLDLHHTFVGDDDAVSLAAGLRGNTALHRLAMHNNYIYDEGARALGEALAENTGLRFLSLSSNAIGDDGAAGLAQGLMTNTGLRRLDLYFNLVGDKGAVAFGKALEQNTALRQLNLDSNSVHCEGARALAAALTKTKSLTELTLAYNQIKAVGAKTLATGATQSASLTKLTLDHNHFINDATRKGELKTLEETLQERRRLAEWLVASDLADPHSTSHHDVPVPEDSLPPLLSPFAGPVKELNAQHAEGLLQLRHLDKAAIVAHAALAPLEPSQRDMLADVLLLKIAVASQHDEL